MLFHLILGKFFHKQVYFLRLDCCFFIPLQLELNQENYELSTTKNTDDEFRNRNLQNKDYCNYRCLAGISFADHDLGSPKFIYILYMKIKRYKHRKWYL